MVAALAYTLKEAAKGLGVSEATLRRMIAAGRVRVVYLAPRSPRIPVSEIDRLLSGTSNRQRAASDGR